MRLTHVEGAILAGGLSSRMRRNKALLEVDGTPMVERVARALSACVSRVSIVLREGADSPIALPEIHDRYANRAPIVGLHAALAAAETPAVLVAACDLPDIQPSLLLGLLSLVPTGAGPAAVVPVGPRGPEPLLAVYRTELLPELERRIERGDLALHRLLESVRALCVPERALRALDPDLRSLRNLNRPEDLRARRSGA